MPDPEYDRLFKLLTETHKTAAQVEAEIKHAREDFQHLRAFMERHVETGHPEGKERMAQTERRVAILEARPDPVVFVQRVEKLEARPSTYLSTTVALIAILGTAATIVTVLIKLGGV